MDGVATVAVALDMKMLCTRSLTLGTGQLMKNEGAMTIFCHPEHLHCQNHADQTNWKCCPFVPIQYQMNLNRKFSY